MPSYIPLIGSKDAGRAPGGICAFTLIELLVVIAIMVAMYSLVVPAITGLKNSSDLTSDAYQIQGALEQARTYAVSNNTYTWVGFFEQNAATPGKSGVGQLVISIVASNDGTSIYNKTQAAAVSSTTQTITPARLVQLNKLVKLANVHVFNATSQAIGARPANPISGNYLIGLPPTPPAQTQPILFSFQYPLLGTAVYKFGSRPGTSPPVPSGIVQFDPQGEATSECGPISGPAPSYEIAIQATNGTAISTSSNIIAIDVSGLTGEATIYRR